MKLILTGATGFVGGEVLRQSLEDAEIAQVTVVSRRPLSVTHPKLRVVVVGDFLDYSELGDQIAADACIWALGVSQTAVSKTDYIRLMFDYATAAAKAMLAANPQLRFCFVSGRSADRDEHHFTLQGNIKGRTERELCKMSPNVVSFRPAFIRPGLRDQKRPVGLRLIEPIARLLDHVSDEVSIDTSMLGHCLLEVAKYGADRTIFRNSDIRRWSSAENGLTKQAVA
jgi:hypothetical protein